MLTVTANQEHVIKLLNHTVSPTAGPCVLLLEYLPSELYIPTTEAEISSYFESLIEVCTPLLVIRFFPSSQNWLRLPKHKKAQHHLHRLGIVHNDVKPNNILWEGGPGGRGVVLIDFGSANIHPPGSSWIPRARAHFTRGFAAPELLVTHPCSHNVDIWSVGAMLFMMVSRRSRSLSISLVLVLLLSFSFFFLFSLSFSRSRSYSRSYSLRSYNPRRSAAARLLSEFLTFSSFHTPDSWHCSPGWWRDSARGKPTVLFWDYRMGWQTKQVS